MDQSLLTAAAREVERVRRSLRPKVTLAAAAATAGISRETWSRAVNGRGVSADTLWDMALAVGAEQEASAVLGLPAPERRRPPGDPRLDDERLLEEVGRRLIELQRERGVRRRPPARPPAADPPIRRDRVG